MNNQESLQVSDQYPLVPDFELSDPYQYSGGSTFRSELSANLLVKTHRVSGSPIIAEYDRFVNQLGDLLDSFAFPFTDIDTPGMVTFEQVEFVKPNIAANTGTGAVQVDQTGQTIIRTIQSQMTRLLPITAIQRGITYAANMFVTMTFQPYDRTKESKSSRVYFGKFPVMIGSILCHTYNMTAGQKVDISMCPNDAGGYFIAGGNAKFFYSQQRMSYDTVLIIPDKSKTTKTTLQNRPKSYYQAIQTTKLPYVTHQTIIIKDLKSDQYLLHTHILDSTVFFNVMTIYMMQLGTTQAIWQYLETFVPEDQWPLVVNELVPTMRDLEATLEKKPAAQILASLRYISSIDRNSAPLVTLMFASLFPKITYQIDKIRQHQIDQLWDLYEGMDYPDDPTVDRLSHVLKNHQLDQLDDLISALDEQFEDPLIDQLLQSQMRIEEFKQYRLDQLSLMLIRLVQVNLGFDQPDDRDSWENKSIITAANNIEKLMVSIMRKYFTSGESNKKTSLVVKAQDLSFENMIGKIPSDLIGDFEASFISGRWMVKGGITPKETLLDLFSPSSMLNAYSQVRMINTPSTRHGTSDRIRQVHPSQFGIVDPIQTPEGGNCGLIAALAILAVISRERQPELIWSKVMTTRWYSPTEIPGYLPMLINGMMMGWVDPMPTYEFLMNEKRFGRLPYDIAPVVLKSSLVVYATGSRLLAPFLLVDEDLQLVKSSAGDPRQMLVNGAMEYLDTRQYHGEKLIYMAQTYQDLVNARQLINELEADQNLATPEELQQAIDNLAKARKRFAYTHLLIDPTQILGTTGSTNPYGQTNNTVRGALACKLRDQAIGSGGAYQADAPNAITLDHLAPSVPLVQTLGEGVFPTMENPSGTNLMVAVMTYGPGQEDSMIINQQVVESGGLMITKWFTVTVNLEPGEKIGLSGLTIRNTDRGRYHAIDSTGIAKVGSFVKANDCLIAKYRIGATVNVNRSIYLDEGKRGFVYRVHHTPSQIWIRIGDIRPPIQGLKILVGRSGQKGTVGEIVPPHEMPYDEITGEVPAVIINPHSILARATLEVLWGIIGSTQAALTGQIVNGTSFRKLETKTFEDLLLAAGYNPTLQRTLVDPNTGERLLTKIYMGVTLISVLKHFSLDKMKISDRPVRDSVTGQPIRGRSDGKIGGARFGRMEIDALISYGASAIKKALLDFQSDSCQITVCRKCHSNLTLKNEVGEYQCGNCPGSEIGVMRLPRTLLYVTGLLAGAGVKLDLNLQDQIVENTIQKVEVEYPTGRRLSRFEEASLVGQRIEDLNAGAKPLIEVTEGMSTAQVAQEEVRLRLAPLVVKRRFPDGSVEEIPLAEFPII